MANTAQMASRRSTPSARRRTATGAAAAGGRDQRAPRSGSTRTGWVLTGLAAVLIVVGGIISSIGPYRDYQDASGRLVEQQAQVALLQQENQALEAEVHRLLRPSYVEGLARKELNLGRPGEEIFVVGDIPSTPTQAPADEAEDPPGPLERLVERLRSLW